jgi:hypothetical protein
VLVICPYELSSVMPNSIKLSNPSQQLHLFHFYLPFYKTIFLIFYIQNTLKKCPENQRNNTQTQLWWISKAIFSIFSTNTKTRLPMCGKPHTNKCGGTNNALSIDTNMCSGGLSLTPAPTSLASTPALIAELILL